MPYPDGNPLAANTIVSERLILAKFQPVQIDTFNLYVDSDTGQDQNPGNGSASAPYKTISRAMSDIGSSSIRETTIINLSGVASHKLPDGYIFPGLFSSDKPSQSGLGFYMVEGPLVIRATPTPVLTVQAADILAQTANPGSGLITLDVSLVLVPGALAGLCMRTAFGGFARVISNTVNKISVCAAGALTAPLQIFSEAATIEADPPGFNPTLCFRGTAPVILQGLYVKENGGLPASSLDASQGQLVFADACRFDSVSLGTGLLEAAPGYFSGSGCLIEKGVQVGAGKFSAFGSLFSPGFISETPGRGAWFFAAQSFFDQPGDFTVDNFSKLQSYAVCELDNCNVINSSADNAVFQRGGILRLRACYFADNLKDWAIVGELGASVTIEGAVLDDNNNGVRIDSGSYAELVTVTGVANLALTMGVFNGAQAKVNAATIIGGGTELKVGSNVAITWAAFHASKNEFDITPVTAQLSRCWEP